MSRGRKKIVEEKTSAHILKNRVEELEAEVLSLKRRLEDLRKAKNTTILKKEKEYVTTSATEPRSSHAPKVSELQRKMEELSLQHTNEMDSLKKRHQEDLGKMQKASPAPSPCDHEKEIADLKRRNWELDSLNKEVKLFNEELKKENNNMREKFDELFTELSIKEAQWCEKEEQLNLKMKLQWGEKYREWMEATEKKIAELQAANTLLMDEDISLHHGPTPSGTVRAAARARRSYLKPPDET